MGLLKVAFYMAFCLTSCLATYGPDAHYRKDKERHEKVILDSPKIHLDNPRIHLDSAKILVNKPKVIEEGHGNYEEEGLYIEKGHSVHSGHGAPILINGGYGGYGGYGGTKVLNLGGPLLVASSPIYHHDGPILVRRPVIVAKELAPTQDHLEKIHYDRLTLGKGYISGGHGIGLGYGHGPILSGISLGGKGGYGEKAVVYGKGAPVHSLGSGLISFQAYQTPYLIGQPKAILTAGHGHIGGGHGYISGGHGLINGGHGLINGGHGLISGGHGLISGGHGHISGGHGHISGGHGHIGGGHGHIEEIHGGGGYKKY
ncbi:uncharacterized protein LOC129984419 [Argiope bruennichi]|uniref:uncharacterized protein LOC129984419 n=1 Tax=Argiope bruennichi TaxID=94029 RepID=UPI0024949430|nr:uncharacterized protein LOC129984419 [Argiope bruennichi]